MNGASTPSSTTLHQVVTEYFNSTSLVKVDNANGFGLYMARVNSMLSNTFRYIIAMVPHDVSLIGQMVPLHELRWTVFQTRSLPARHPRDGPITVPTFAYSPKKHGFFSSELVVKPEASNSEYSTYASPTFPNMTLTLMSSANIGFLPSHGNLNSALESFSTIIQLA